MYKKTLISFGGQPILKVSTGEFLNKKELDHIKKIPYVKHNESETMLSVEDSILNHKKLNRIKDIVWSEFCEYVDQVLEVEDDFYMSNSWCTLQEKGGLHPYHNHPGSIFSSTYYAQAHNGSLSFSTPESIIQSGFNFDYRIKNYNYFNSLTWKIPVTTGDLIIFPANISHESGEHKGPETRIMLGASYFIKGKLGFKEKYNQMDI